MPKIKERNLNDKIKKTGKAQQPKGTLRIMTAKLRKNLAQHGQEGGEHTADTQAVEQTTQVGTYAAEEIVSRMEGVVDRMIQPSRHPKTRKEKLKGNGRIPKADTSAIRPIIDPWRNSESGSPEINTHSVPPVGDTSGYEITIDSDAPEGTNTGSQPTPEARMKKQAAEELKRSAGAELPGDSQFREVSHYGGSPQNPYITKKEHSPGNQSINQSIHQTIHQGAPQALLQPKRKTTRRGIYTENPQKY